MKRLFTSPIKVYQSVSRLLPANCRYYPSCSEYAIWQFETNKVHKALLLSSSRILKCNPFFQGGIDYPKIRYNTPTKTLSILVSNKTHSKMPIKYWFVPATNGQHHAIRDINDTSTP